MGGRFLAWVARGRMLLRNMVLAWRRDGGLLKTVKSFSCAGKGGSAGLRPAPASSQGNVYSQSQSQSQSQSGSGLSVAWRGGVGLRGRRKPVHGGLAAASMPRTPRNPTPPHLRQFPGDGWMGIGRPEPCVDERQSKSNISTSERIEPSTARLYKNAGRSRKSVEGGVGPVAGVSAAWMPRPSPQGRVYGVPRNRSHPDSPQETSFCCCCCCCSSSERVQGAALPNTPLMLRRRMHSAEPACST